MKYNKIRNKCLLISKTSEKINSLSNIDLWIKYSKRMLLKKNAGLFFAWSGNRQRNFVEL
jgi:hypothetical protein